MSFEKWWAEQETRIKHRNWGEDMQCAWDAATKEERKTCAEICDDIANETDPDDFAIDAVNGAADAIRKRPNQI